MREGRRFYGPPCVRARFLGQIGALSGQKKTEVSPLLFGVAMAKFFPRHQNSSARRFFARSTGFLGRRGVRARFLGKIGVLPRRKSRSSPPAPLALPWQNFSYALKILAIERCFARATGVLGRRRGRARFLGQIGVLSGQKAEVSPRPFGVAMADFFRP